VCHQSILCPVILKDLGMIHIFQHACCLHSGGTELGLMSTTGNIAVAVQYSLSPVSLLFKIKVESFMEHGAGEKCLNIQESLNALNFVATNFFQVLLLSCVSYEERCGFICMKTVQSS
jgi:hypothetical protein